MLTFSTQLKSSWAYFQLNMTQLNWKLSQFNLTHQELKLNIKRAKYRNFSNFLSELKSMKVRVLQKIKNKHENYSSTLSSSSQMRIWVYENWSIKSTRNSTADSQKHWVYENLYRWFSETLSLQEFKSHTNLNISSMIRVQVTYNLQEILHELHVILLISLMMLKFSLLNI